MDETAHGGTEHWLLPSLPPAKNASIPCHPSKPHVFPATRREDPGVRGRLGIRAGPPWTKSTLPPPPPPLRESTVDRDQHGCRFAAPGGPLHDFSLPGHRPHMRRLLRFSFPTRGHGLSVASRLRRRSGFAPASAGKHVGGEGEGGSSGSRNGLPFSRRSSASPFIIGFVYFRDLLCLGAGWPSSMALVLHAPRAHKGPGIGGGGRVLTR
ncbi:hypothetical protein LX36DRAFT_653875 [Colletotrichum falcatum]|nr:hypothetical protein LX36DRAFT_653875 [Colletotrichum falcatum]